MDADFSVELGGEDPVLDFPWTDAAGRLAYFDLKRHPELLAQVEEASELPELAEFLRCVNSARSEVESAKCDAWTMTELTPEEEIFAASHKFASYVDLVLSNADQRQSFAEHERFAKRLVALLRRVPEVSSSVEICVRRCFFGGASEAREGFYFTVYVNGYGNDEAVARQNWALGINCWGVRLCSCRAPSAMSGEDRGWSRGPSTPQGICVRESPAPLRVTEVEIYGRGARR